MKNKATDSQPGDQRRANTTAKSKQAQPAHIENEEPCNVSVYWWNGEYDGVCELPKGHLEPFHYDGISYFDDDNNNRNEEQANLVRLINQQITQTLSQLEGKAVKVTVYDGDQLAEWVAVSLEEISKLKGRYEK